MTPKKYIVTEELHVRRFCRLLNEGIIGVLYPGFILDAVSEEFGDTFRDSNVWLRDGNGFYYWKGGFKVFAASESVGGNYPISYTNYNQIINLPEQFKQTKGKEVVIAIVDTGCYKHIAFSNSLLDGYNALIDSKTRWEDDSYDGHGTRVAGLIVSNGNESNIIGVAPESKLIIVKVAENSSVSPAAVLNALKWLADDSRQNYIKPDIINLSFEIDPGNLSTDFDAVISRLRSKGTLLIAAAQNDDQLFNTNIFYPGAHKEVLSVGALRPYLSTPGEPLLNNEINFILPNLRLFSTVSFGVSSAPLGGCSFSTALLSGAAALAISYCKQFEPLKDPIEALNTILPKFTNPNIDQSIKIYKHEKNFS